MQWTKPEFEEVSLAMEATAYANTDTSVVSARRSPSVTGALATLPQAAPAATPAG